MKRLIICLVTILVILLLSASVPCYLNKSTNQLTEKIMLIKKDMNNHDYKRAYTKTIELVNLWDEKHKIITIFVNHNEIDNVTYISSRLPCLLKYGNKSEFCAELDHVLTIINSIYKDDLPTWENII